MLKLFSRTRLPRPYRAEGQTRDRESRDRVPASRASACGKAGPGGPRPCAQPSETYVMVDNFS